MVDKFRYVSSRVDCKISSCPVMKGEVIEANRDGKDEYRLFENIGLAKEVFGEQIFAACYVCHSHTTVEKVEKEE